MNGNFRINTDTQNRNIKQYRFCWSIDIILSLILFYNKIVFNSKKIFIRRNLYGNCPVIPRAVELFIIS